MTPGTKVKAAWRRNFIRHVRNGKPLTIAAQLAGVGKDKVFQERNRDPDFDAEWEEAKASSSRSNTLRF